MELKMAKSHSHGHSHSRSTNLNAAAMGRGQANKRRSNRMTLNATVGLSGEDRTKCSFSMPARATNLNKHGAAIELSRDLPLGTVVTIKNKTGAQISARVVALLRALQGVSTYGVEFVENDERAQNFWGISFPSNA
jgi:PilZ domain